MSHSLSHLFTDHPTVQRFQYFSIQILFFFLSSKLVNQKTFLSEEIAFEVVSSRKLFYGPQMSFFRPFILYCAIAD